MSKIIQHRELQEVVSYSLSYVWNDSPGSGFGFDCDEKGNVFLDQLKPEALENYNACASGGIDVRCNGVEQFVRRYTKPAVLECDCGDHVALSSFTNT